MDIRVIIFEDNKLIRDAINTLLNSTPGYLCCAVMEDGRQWKQSVDSYRPDVILMDIGMPGLNGIELCKLITAQYPDISILIQTVFSDADKIFEALCAGASGYILKTEPLNKYLDAIKEIVGGGAPMSAAVAKKTLAFFKTRRMQFAHPTGADYNLSEREEEILRLMTDRYPLREIADKLFISYETVRTHVKHIYKKLHVSSKSEAILTAIQNRTI
jgi:DNA-binding NarL/FixJ family response regulator